MEFKSIISSDFLNSTRKLVFNHVYKIYYIAGDFRFVFKKKQPCMSNEIINHSKEKPITIDRSDGDGALNVHLQKFKNFTTMRCAMRKGQFLLFGQRANITSGITIGISNIKEVWTKYMQFQS